MDQVIVTGMADDEEFLGTRVTVMEAEAEPGGHDGIFGSKEDGHGAAVVSEPFRGRVSIAQDPADGQERVMVPGDAGEAVKGGEEEEAGDPVGMG